MFQNLRTNAQLYILHKDGTPYVECGSVTNVSAPRAKYPTPMPMGQYPQMEMVVDVTVNVGGQNTNLQGLPAGAEIADFGQNGNIVVSCSKEAMNSEIANFRQKSVDIVNSEDYHKGVINACDKMLNSLNPDLAEKRKHEEEMNGMKEKMDEMMRRMSVLSEQNKQLMEQFGISETK